jgi:HEAT repeat protein
MTLRLWYRWRLAAASVRLLTSKNEREVAAEFLRLKAFEDDRNVVGMIHMLDSDVRGQSEHSIVRGQAAAALGQMGDPRAIPHLMEMRDDSEEQVRFSVIRALGRLKAKEAESLLLETLDDPSPLLRMSAASALGHLGAVDAIPRLRKSLDSDPDSEVRVTAVEALVILGDESARVQVPEALSEIDARTRELPRWRALEEAAETGEALAPWVSRWESNPPV